MIWPDNTPTLTVKRWEFLTLRVKLKLHWAIDQVPKDCWMHNAGLLQVMVPGIFLLIIVDATITGIFPLSSKGRHENITWQSNWREIKKWLNKNPGCVDYIMIQTRILCTNEIIYLLISEKCTKWDKLIPILWLFSSSWFERLTMTVILFNCVTLGMYQPCEDNICDTQRCKILKVRAKKKSFTTKAYEWK